MVKKVVKLVDEMTTNHELRKKAVDCLDTDRYSTESEVDEEI